MGDKYEFIFEPEVPKDLPAGSVTAAIFQRSLESWKQQIQTFIVGYRFFQWRYMRLYNYNTYALGEYVGLGPSTDFEINWSSGALLGSDRDYIRFAGSAWWTWRFLADGFIRPSIFFHAAGGNVPGQILGHRVEMAFSSMGVGEVCDQQLGQCGGGSDLHREPHLLRGGELA